MRILVVCQHFWPENFRINEICYDFVDNGHSVDVLCGMPNYPKGKYYKGYNYFGPRREQHHGIEIFRVGEIPQNKRLGALGIILNYYFFPFASLFSLPRLLKRQYDVVFLYSVSPVFMSWPGIVFAKLKKLPTVMCVMDYWPDSLFSIIKTRNRLFRAHYRWVSRWHYKRVDLLITPSKGMIQKFKEDFTIDPERITFIPQSCDAIYEEKLHSPELHRKYDGRFNFVFAGNVGPAQALEVLVDAVEIVSAKKPELKFRFIIIGDGMSKEGIVRRVSEKGLAEYFEFIGFQPVAEIVKYQELADVLYVSLSDSPLFQIMIPTKVQSYMASGKPILAALAGEGADVIRESKAGMTCRLTSLKELADTIESFIGLSAETRAEMGHNAETFYKNNYRNDIISSQLIRTITNVKKK